MRRKQAKQSPEQFVYEMAASNDTSPTLHPEWRDLAPAEQALWEKKAEEVYQLLLERQHRREEDTMDD
jgi:hypothetical protein